jgi:hypothetical protein
VKAIDENSELTPEQSLRFDVLDLDFEIGGHCVLSASLYFFYHHARVGSVCNWSGFFAVHLARRVLSRRVSNIDV